MVSGLTRRFPAGLALALSIVVGLFQEAGAVEHALLLAGTAAIPWRIFGLSDGEWARW